MAHPLTALPHTLTVLTASHPSVHHPSVHHSHLSALGGGVDARCWEACLLPGDLPHTHQSMITHSCVITHYHLWLTPSQPCRTPSQSSLPHTHQFITHSCFW